MIKPVNGEGSKTRLSVKKSEINYNENIYLHTNLYNEQIETELSEQINKIKNTVYVNNLDVLKNKSIPLNLKLNINHNYYNTNIQIVEHKDDQKQSIGWIFKNFWNMFISTFKSKENRQSSNETINKHPQIININKITKTRKKKNKIVSENTQFIQCTNCDNLITINNIDTHSNICTTVKEEVFNNENCVSIFQKIDYKLKKLLSNIQKLIKNKNSKLTKDLHCITLLEDYITKSINLDNSNQNTIADLKNVITNIETLIVSHKGSISTLILLERAKVIAVEKFRIIKEDIRINKDLEKSKFRKNAYLFKNSNKEILEEIKKRIDEEMRKKQLAENERDNLKRKVNSFRKTNEIFSPRNLSISDIEIRNSQIFNNDQTVKVSKNLNSSKNISINALEEILSDFETKSKRSYVDSDYDNTSYSQSFINTNNVNDIVTAGDKENDIINLTDSRRFLLSPVSLSRNIKNSKTSYQEFVSIVLKIKFEKLSRSNRGQLISEKALWNESIRQKIEVSKWPEFIMQEINNPDKYDELLKNKFKKNFNMDTIHEEVTLCN